jgi:hypothetical protein
MVEEKFGSPNISPRSGPHFVIRHYSNKFLSFWSHPRPVNCIRLVFQKQFFGNRHNGPPISLLGRLPPELTHYLAEFLPLS